jgi:hypothetical protein
MGKHKKRATRGSLAEKSSPKGNNHARNDCNKHKPKKSTNFIPPERGSYQGSLSGMCRLEERRSQAMQFTSMQSISLSTLQKF